MMKWFVLAGVLLTCVTDPGHGHVVLALLVAAALFRVLCSMSAKPSTYHGHGVTRQEASFHEAGHVVVARHRGASGVAARVTGTSGVTTAAARGTIDEAIILAAGSEAARRFFRPNPATCQEDAVQLAEVCRQLGIDPRQARRVARREVDRHGYEIKRVAERLNRRGRVWT